jgi:protein O-mannosyl-transferase
MTFERFFRSGYLLLFIGLCVAAAVYWPGLTGGWLFDDYPNIVDNPGVQPSHFSFSELVRAALSSPASEFKRPLASLSFALNYLTAGLDPFTMKLTNLVIHLLNGTMVFALARLLLKEVNKDSAERSSSHIAAWVAIAWLLLPINLTSVLYVVQRMESLANLFVLMGLVGYVAGRRRMLHPNQTDVLDPSHGRMSGNLADFSLCVFSIVIPMAVGALAKETAVMLPLYAFLIEWFIFRFRTMKDNWDHRLTALFVLVLALPMIIGLFWLMPHTMDPNEWATRDFTLRTRQLSEARIVVAYIAWTLLPMPNDLSFYHDNFVVSTGILTPWTTVTSILTLLSLATLACWLRTRKPLLALGIALYLGCHLLTATLLPLELVYEHRNYFASMGLILAVVPSLAGSAPTSISKHLPVLRRALLASLLLLWGTETWMTASAWGDPLSLAQVLAARAPDSPRAQYELGRTYIIYSHYDPASPYARLAYAPLERAAQLPGSSILPEQALIFMNARMNLPAKDTWWESMIQKLKSHKPTIQDESSLSSLTQCERDGYCVLSQTRMKEAYQAALAHPNPSARLLALYSDYAWNVLQDHSAGLSAIQDAVFAAPYEPAYRITLIRMLVAQKKSDAAKQQLDDLQRLNVGGYLNNSIKQMQSLISSEP